MIVACPVPQPIGEIVTRNYEGPGYEDKIEIRCYIIREATEDEYLRYGKDTFGDVFEPNEHKDRGWDLFYEISVD